MAAAAHSPASIDNDLADSASRQQPDEYFQEDMESRIDGAAGSSMRDKEKKIGHRRVDKLGIVSYKKKPTSELMAAIQLGIGQSVGGLSSKPERDVLMQDFAVVEVVFFPGEGSNLTPAHHYSDFRFKTYAPVAFRYFRDLFGIQPDDFMLSLCNEPLKELSNPGASGSIFYLTHDDEFIIKTVQHKEAEFLQKLLPGYFLNISQNKRTLLPKFYGLYCYQCGGKNIRFTVMNNLLPSTVQLHEKYDMKGSTYKRKASKSERSKKTPTLKDLDFIVIHPECLQLEKDIHDSLLKTLQRDCRVLESFKIMDYSLLVGIYNLDQINKEQNQAALTMADNEASLEPLNSSGIGLHRTKSIRTRIGQYSTPLESIQGNTDLKDDMEEDDDVPPGGIPARNAKGERLLMYLGIIDILQSFRLKKRLEHTVKSMVIDGDTISVHRPSYYAQRFLQYHATRVFRKAPTALKHSPSKRRAQNKSTKIVQTPQTEVLEHSSHCPVRSGRAISFSDEQNEEVGKPPDLLPEYSKAVKRSPVSRARPGFNNVNMNGNSTHPRKSDAFSMSTYPSEDALSAGTASTASLRAVGLGSGYPPTRGASPPLSLSESTPTHTDFTEGTPSFTNSSPSCSSDVMAPNKATTASCSTIYPATATSSSINATTNTTTTTTTTPAKTSEISVTFKLPPLVEKDSSENMGGLSPLDVMDSPTSTSRSPDLHHRRLMHSGKVGGVGSRSRGSTELLKQEDPTTTHPSPTKRGTLSNVAVTVIPESPPPPFESVVQDAPPLAVLPSPHHVSDLVEATAAMKIEEEEAALLSPPPPYDAEAGDGESAADKVSSSSPPPPPPDTSSPLPSHDGEDRAADQDETFACRMS